MRLKLAYEGRNYKDGGLNVTDIKEILQAKGLKKQEQDMNY